MNHYLQNQYLETRSKFEKFSRRLQRSQEKGEFQKLSRGKQHFLVNRVKRLWEKLRLLEVQLKVCSAGVSLALLLMVSNADAQEQFVHSPAQNPAPPPTIYGWSPVVADLDADGDMDLFITSWDYYLDPRVLYYRNVGTPQAPDFQKAPDNENPFRALTSQTDFQSWEVNGIGDVDNDGDMDMISSAGYLLRNLGGNETPLFSEEALDFGIDNMDLGDIDGDGDLDLIQVTYDGSVSVLLNTGDESNFNIDGTSPVTANIGNWNNNMDWIFFTRALDVDGDGDLDLVFGGEVYDYDNEIFDWFIFVAENTGDTTDPVFALLDDADNPYLTQGNFGIENLSLGDMDGDGDYDLVVMDYGLGMQFIEMDNGLVENRDFLQELYDGILLPFNYYLNPQFADLDGDDDPDLMAFNSFGNWDFVYFEYQETGQQLKYVKDDQRDIRVLNNPFMMEFPFYLDMDGDGDLDVMSMAYDFDYYKTEFHYFENTGSAQDPLFEAAANNPVLVRDYYVLPSFADIDGDGDTDLFLSYQIWDDPSQSWMGVTSFFKNSGGAEPTFTEQFGTGNPIDQVREANYPAFDYVRVLFGDIDEDGDLDATFNDYYGIIHFLENTGSVSQPSFVDRSSNSPFTNIWAGYYSMINLVDMDGDGDLDLMIHPYNRMLNVYYENTGYQGGTFIRPPLPPERLEVFPNPVIGDLFVEFGQPVSGGLTYEILTVHGQRVTNGTIEMPGDELRFTIPAADLSPGLYMIRIRNGEQLYLSKFVKR